MNIDDMALPGARIKVIGVGGGGGNAVNTMIRSNIEGVEFICCNTDIQALQFSLADKKIQIGRELTRGLGAGADPDVGRDAALEDRHAISEALEGANMVFVTAGMGGGTGTGGASIVAQIAKDLGALTVAVVTKPFGFEGKRRRRQAEIGIERLKEQVDTLIAIPNQRLLQVSSSDLSMIDAFRMADTVLVNAVKGISDIINVHGYMNVDFADVKTVMSAQGMALMGIGLSEGKNGAVEAAHQAISSPLLEDVDIEGAIGILINITSGEGITVHELGQACTVVQDAAHEDANIIVGHVFDEEIGDKIRVTVIATGFPPEPLNEDAYNMPVQPKFVPQKQPALNPIMPASAASKPQQQPQQPQAASQLNTPAAQLPLAPQAEQQAAKEPLSAALEAPAETPTPKEPQESLLMNGQSLTEMTLSGASDTKPQENTAPLEIPLQMDDINPSSSINPHQTSTPLERKGAEGPAKEAASSELEAPIMEEKESTSKETLELAERLQETTEKTQKEAEDDLDIPAFLRNSMKDMPLT